MTQTEIKKKLFIRKFDYSNYYRHVARSYFMYFHPYQLWSLFRQYIQQHNKIAVTVFLVSKIVKTMHFSSFRFQLLKMLSFKVSWIQAEISCASFLVNRFWMFGNRIITDKMVDEYYEHHCNPRNNYTSDFIIEDQQHGKLSVYNPNL